MKIAGALCLIVVLTVAQTRVPVLPDSGKTPGSSPAAVRDASVSLDLRGDRGLTLKYRTISAGKEVMGMPGYPEHVRARPVFEQIMTQRLMQSRLVVEVPVELAGIRLDPGQYGLGLSGFEDGNFDLAVLKDRERFSIPVIMDPSPFEAPQITFSMSSLSADEAALVLHARKRCGVVKIKIPKEKKKDGGEKE
jgi:hypothetical protein